MKNIKYILFISLFILSSSVNAQTGKLKKGEESYEVYSYTESIEKFEGLAEKTFEIKKKLAESYYKTGDYYKAEEYYSEVASTSKSTSEDIYNYASVLAVNKKYSESEDWMEKFYQLERGDSRAKIYNENKGFYNILLKDNEQFKIKNLDVNTSTEDFGTAFYMDKVVFASSRTGAKFIKRIWNWNELPFLDLYVADIEGSQLTNVSSFKKTFNKKYHEGPASYNKEGNYTAFTRNNYTGKSKEGIIKLQIFTSEKDSEKWKKPSPMHFNSSEYSVGHPALTADGKTMYFASDMPGGFGKVDIYIVHMNENGEWGKPENLGKRINTEGNEMFPFIHKEGILFYASDGLPGLGGLDIFFTMIKESGLSKPKNLGVPVNSNFDDFALIVDSKMRKGYFSSNRNNGKGDDDIYSFRLLKPISSDVIIKGTTKDENGNLLANTEVSIYDTDREVIKMLSSDEDGAYELIVAPDQQYKIIASKPKFITDIEDVKLEKDDEIIEKDLILEQLPDFTLLCEVNEKDNNIPVSGARVSVTDNKANVTDILNTYDSGEFLVKLDDYKLNDSIDFTFTLEKEGYASKTIDYVGLLNRSGEYKFKVNMQKIEVGEDLGKILEINPIYFNFDKSYIRSDAALELDKIVKIMNEYPNMVIELSSHTDCRGSGIYNLKLSDRRAKASAHYIKTRITKPTRIYGEGYGEQKLINKCPCESSNKSDCTEREHQQNRRTEFKIIRK